MEKLTPFIKHILVIVAIALIGVLIYPTLWEYDKLYQELPVKINRITGSTYILTNQGWTKASNNNSSTAEMDKFKAQVVMMIQTDRDNLKNSNGRKCC